MKIEAGTKTTTATPSKGPEGSQLDTNGIPAGAPPDPQWGAFKLVANHIKATLTVAMTQNSMKDIGTDVPGYFASSSYYRVDMGKVNGKQCFAYFNSEEAAVLLVAQLNPEGARWFSQSAFGG